MVLGTTRSKGIVPRGHFSSLSASLFLRTDGKFLSVLRSPVFVSSSQTDWLPVQGLTGPLELGDDSIPNPSPKPLVQSVVPHLIGISSSALGTAGGLVHSSPFVCDPDL